MPVGVYKKTEEHKRKLSEAGKGRISPMKGKHQTEIAKKKMSEAHKGKTLSKEHAQKIKEALLNKPPMKGKNHSEKTKLKMSNAKKGLPSPRKGIKCSEETLKKMSLAMTGEKSHKWKGGKTIRICLICKKEFKVFPCRIERGEGKFCSLRCSSIWKVKHQKKKDTDIEILMKNELSRQSIPYLQQTPIEGIALVDFLLPNKIIIQCDGSYWHFKKEVRNRDINQDFILGFKGYKVYRFSEKEIYSSKDLAVTLLKIWKGQGDKADG